MSRKDFVLIARAIQAMVLPADMRLHVAEMMAATISHTNSRFDRERFIAACMPSNV